MIVEIMANMTTLVIRKGVNKFVIVGIYILQKQIKYMDRALINKLKNRIKARKVGKDKIE